jgi:hypothetical protein
LQPLVKFLPRHRVLGGQALGNCRPEALPVLSTGNRWTTWRLHSGSGWDAHVQALLEHGSGATDATGVLFLSGGFLLIAAGALLVERTVRLRRRGMTGRPVTS